MKHFAAHSRAQRFGITADILTRDSQGSAGYWEIVQDSLADLVRIQLGRCYDKEGHPDLYNYVRGLRGGAVWQVAFPNLFTCLSLWLPMSGVSCFRISLSPTTRISVLRRIQGF